MRKPFFVCTTAAANKFLRIYYARVKECLNAAESAISKPAGAASSVSGDHCSSVRDIINLTQNLDCYGFYPGVSDEETLGRIYVDDLEMLDVPDQVKPYFDYEAYGRDACIHENGHFAPGGYVVKESDHFVEVYHGLQDIPKEHKVFSFPKLSIREQMAAYQEIIDGSSLEGYRQMQKKDRGDR